MTRMLQRLAAALALSGGCFYATVYWYHSGNTSSIDRGDRQPIARLESSVNEVQRKPLTRMIWERVSLNDDLYGGEAIRTNAHSEARIFFARTGTLIELEPESMIVLEEGEDGIALNFLSGHLLVRSQGDATAEGSSDRPSVTLRSAGQDISLQQAEVSLSADQQGTVNLEVLSGQAQVLSGGQSQTLQRDQRALLATDQEVQVERVQLKTLSPQAGTPVLINPDQREPVLFRWEPLPPGYQVILLAGARRSELTPVVGASAAGEAGQLTAPARVGRYFWQLEARRTDEARAEELPSPLFSSTQPLEVIAKLPPIPLEPLPDAELTLRPENPRVRMSWTPRGQMSQLILEVASDPQLQNKLHSLTLDSHQTSVEVELPQEGTYYWRLTGFIPVGDKTESASSPLRQFRLSLSPELAAPQLRSPEEDQILSEAEVQRSGVLFSWNPVREAASYRIRLQKLEIEPSSDGTPPTTEVNTLLDQVVSSPSHRSGPLTPGLYRWAVVATDQEGKHSKPSDFHSFRVEGLKEIQWAQAEPVIDSLYWSEQPQLIVQWQQDPSLTHLQWRVRIAPQTSQQDNLSRDIQSTEASQVIELKTSETYIQTPVPRDGRYRVIVEALSDPAQQVVARSSVKTVQVRPQPFLPAPRFAASLPEELRSDARGNIDLSWNPVPGATSYQLEIIDAEGNKVLERSPQGQSTQLRQLRPGEYQVRLLSMDQHQRLSREAATRRLQVPRQSDIQAPRLKRIEVQ